MTAGRLHALLLLSMVSMNPVTDSRLSGSERGALVDAFYSLGGEKWRNGTGAAGGWLQGDPCKQRWYGVTCDPNNTHVVEFYPSQPGSGNALTGHIPASIGNLTSLRHLVLSNAFTHSGNLRGTIPASFASLSKLQCVYFSHNRLSGTIPAAVSSMSQLQGFFMKGQSLSGSLPDVRQWRDLRSVDLDGNLLTGDLSGFAQLPKLAVLIAHNNRLSGKLSPGLNRVFQCDARNNQWQCPLPPRGSNGTRCCLVDSCLNSSDRAVRVPPAVTIPGVQVVNERRRILQADPGDHRPYGTGYHCHCHTPPPRLSETDAQPNK